MEGFDMIGPEQILWLIVSFILIGFILDRVLSWMNSRNWKNEVPEDMKDTYDQEQYDKAHKYEVARSKFALISSVFGVMLILLMLAYEGFALLDDAIKDRIDHPFATTLLFFACLFIASDLLTLPFSLYSTFVIEEQFGFNKMNLSTFFKDKVKSWLLGAIIGGGILSLFIWFYNAMGPQFWIPIWIVLTLFGIFMTMFYTSLIVPIFNKLTPLEEGSLRDAIEAYCQQVDFTVSDLYVMDGSKRSSKSNAYFSGLGPKKKIVLFDTLIEKQGVEEIVAVLAHEIGHYKHKHTLLGMILSFIQSGIMLYILSLVIGSSSLGLALGVEDMSLHVGLVGFALLYSPVSTLVGIGMNVVSRINEFQADAYAAKTYIPDKMISALKKLSADNLSNLTPHPAYVFVHYSHPPILKRIEAIKNIQAKSEK